MLAGVLGQLSRLEIVNYQELRVEATSPKPAYSAMKPEPPESAQFGDEVLYRFSAPQSVFMEPWGIE
jgi:hypothetical protein